jgi:DNA topoisomerase-1
MREVAHYMGNTPSVCRASYVYPRLVDRYRAGETIRAALDAAGRIGQGPAAVEAEVVDLLDGASEVVEAA